MIIRDALPTDLPAIVAIYNSTIPSRMVTADTEPVSVASRERWFAEHAPARRPLWVAEDHGQILGWLSYTSFYGRPAYDRTCEISIYVSSDHRQAGLGTTLLRRSIAHAPSIGVDNLVGFIFAHNDPSLRLFVKCGFDRWGYLPRVTVLDQIERDVVIMGLRVEGARP